MVNVLGYTWAKFFGDLHEDRVADQSAAEKSMDLYNNSMGRSYGQKNSTWKAIRNACYWAANVGILKIKP